MSTTIEYEPDTAAPTGSALVLYKEMPPAVLFAEGAAMGLVEKIEAEAAKWKFDPTTEKGRKACISASFDIRKAKAGIDKLGLQLTADMRAKVDKINAERKKVEERLEALAEKVRAPVTAWEQRDAKRVQAHKEVLFHIQVLASDLDGLPIAAIESRLATLHAMPPREWEEFTDKANEAMAAAEDGLGDLLERLTADEADRVRLAAEAAAAQVKRDAEIAAAARKEAEEKADLARQQQHRDEMRSIALLADNIHTGMASYLIAQVIEQVEKRTDARAWEEFAEEANRRRDNTTSVLREVLQIAEAREKDEAEAADLARVRGHREALTSLEAIAKHDPGKDSPDTLRAKQAELRRATGARNWQEFADEAGTKSDALFEALEASIDAANERAAAATAAANEARIAAHRDALAAIPSLTEGAETMSHAELLVMRRHLAGLIQRPDRDWQEFGKEALAAYQAEHKRIEGLVSAAFQREEAEAEARRKEVILAERRALIPKFAKIADEWPRGTADDIRSGLSQISALFSYTMWGDASDEATLAANAARQVLEPLLADAVAREADGARQATASTRRKLVAPVAAEEPAPAPEPVTAPTADRKRTVVLAIASALAEFKIPDAKAIAIAKAIEGGKIPHVSVSYAEPAQP